MTYKIRAGKVEWNCSDQLNVINIIGYNGQTFEVMAFECKSASGNVVMVSIYEPRDWIKPAFGDARLHLAVDSKGRIIARAVHLVDALEKVKP